MPAHTTNSSPSSVSSLNSKMQAAPLFCFFSFWHKQFAESRSNNVQMPQQNPILSLVSFCSLSTHLALDFRFDSTHGHNNSKPGLGSKESQCYIHLCLLTNVHHNNLKPNTNYGRETGKNSCCRQNRRNPEVPPIVRKGAGCQHLAFL